MERTKRQARSGVTLDRGLTSLRGRDGDVRGRRCRKREYPARFGEDCISFDTKGRGPFGECLVDARATRDRFSHGPDQQFAALCAREVKRIAEHIPGPLRATIFKGRTRAEERRSKNNAQTDLVSVEDELDIALHVDEENTMEQALQMDIEASVEMPTGKIQDLPPPPTAQEEVHRSPFRKAFEHS